MDYYKSGDLSQFLNKKALKEKFCRKYMKQLSEGLHYLLNNNILHVVSSQTMRTVKTDQVMAYAN